MTDPLVIACAALVALVAAPVLARRTGVSAPLLLVAIGAVAACLPGAADLAVPPELVLDGVLPPLLYAAALRLPVTDVRRNFALITWLSMAMVVVTAVVVGAVVHLVLGLPLALSIAFGAVVSPTDAVAATAIARRVGLPERLVSVLEGESLLNDAAALVVLGAALTAAQAGDAVTLGGSAIAFAWAVAGGIGVGLPAGWLAVRLRVRLADPLAATVAALAVPFACAGLAERMGASSVLAVVVAGLVAGTTGPRLLPAPVRANEQATWRTVAHVLEGGLFLALGWQLPGLWEAAAGAGGVARALTAAGLALALLVALRVSALAWPGLLVLYGTGRQERRVRGRIAVSARMLEAAAPRGRARRLDWARRRLAQDRADLAFEAREPLTPAGLAVLAWSGMRGAITVAAAQTIPEAAPSRDTLVLAAFVVAVATLAVFGSTLPRLISRLGFSAADPDAVDVSARRLAVRVADAVPDEVAAEGPPLSAGLRQWALVPAAPAPTAGPDQLGRLRHELALQRSVGEEPNAAYDRVAAVLDELEIGRSPADPRFSGR